MWRNLKVFICLVGFAVVNACASGGSSIPTGGESSTRLPIPDATTSITPADLRIGPMDSLEISVFGVTDLDGTYQVDFEGLLKMPLIGEISAVGKTAGELSIELEQKYEESFLQDPDVNVIILESVGRRITVDGSINNPGLYPVTGNMSLLQSVALAGGPSQGANPKRVVVFRQIGGERHAAAFDLVAIRNGNAEDPIIFGNDIIVVDGSEARATYGEVLRSLPLLALFMAF